MIELTKEEKETLLISLLKMAKHPDYGWRGIRAHILYEKLAKEYGMDMDVYFGSL